MKKAHAIALAVVAAVAVCGGGYYVFFRIETDRKRGTMNATALQRARSAEGHGITYKLGQGGYHPTDPLPTRTGTCDCSGFISWCFGRSRDMSAAFPHWLSTDSIYDDAKGAQILFEKLDAAEPGCLAVYPDHDGHQGHVAMVIQDHTVIDCSDSHNGITEHTAEYFWNGSHPTIFCRYKLDLPAEAAA